MPTVEKREELRERLESSLSNKVVTVTSELGNLYVKDQEITVKIWMTYEGVSQQTEEGEFPINVFFNKEFSENFLRI
jgi:hypothetical protein